MKIILYIAAILSANIVTALIAPTQIFGLMIPAGSWLIGLTFIMRDFVQEKYGRRVTYVVIAIALLLSGITAVLTGSGMMVVIASAAAFLISESADTEVYTRLRVPVQYRVLWSGIAGGILDSIVFVMIAGFPAQAIIGQMAVKIVMQAAGAGAISLLSSPSPRPNKPSRKAGAV